MTTPDQAAVVETFIPQKSISNRVRKSVQFLPHLCFVTALFFVVAPQYFTGPVSFFLLHKFISLALQVIPLAINYYVLVPVFFTRNKWLYAGMLTKLIALFTLLNYWRFFSMDAAFVPPYVQPGEPITTFMFLFATMGIINVAALFFRVSSQRQKELEKKHRIEKANLESELQFLRLQLSPHFYFNVMNTIYHSIKLNPEQAEDVTLQLSEIMQYHIYECTREKVELSKELKNIHNYISLQQIRLASQPRINVEVKGDLQNKYIAPLLLITFVENSFKHGLEKLRDAFLDIHVSIDENTLRFKIVNSKPEITSDNAANGSTIAHLKKRLNLIYPSRHALTVEESADRYSVLLDLHMN